MYRILLVEDSIDARELFTTLLTTCDRVFEGDVTIDSTDSIARASDYIKKFRYDVVLLDLTVADSTRDNTIPSIPDYITEGWPPIVVITGSSEIEVRNRCLAFGVADFELKPNKIGQNLFWSTLLWSRIYNIIVKEKLKIK